MVLDTRSLHRSRMGKNVPTLDDRPPSRHTWNNARAPVHDVYCELRACGWTDGASFFCVLVIGAGKCLIVSARYGDVFICVGGHFQGF